jgi:hypothetical protein
VGLLALDKTAAVMVVLLLPVLRQRSIPAVVAVVLVHQMLTEATVVQAS